MYSIIDLTLKLRESICSTSVIIPSVFTSCALLKHKMWHIYCNSMPSLGTYECERKSEDLGSDYLAMFVL